MSKIMRSGGLSPGWLRKFELAKESAAKLGRNPTFHEPMGRWLHHQRMATRSVRSSENKLMTRDRVRLLDQHLPGWSKDLDERWLDKMIALKVVYESLGRLPYQSEEMGRWLATQKQSARHQKRWSEFRQNNMDEHFPGWLDGHP